MVENFQALYYSIFHLDLKNLKTRRFYYGFIMHFRYRKMIFLLLAYLINNNLALADNKNIEFDIDSL